MRTFKCPECGDIILIVMGEEVDETELHTKIQNHRNKRHDNIEELEELYKNS